MTQNIIGIRPCQYIHVLDVNQSITRLVIGPQTFVAQTHEQVVAGPLPCIIVPPGHYCTVLDPCIKAENGVPLKQNFGHRDIRFHGEPFSLYPGETLKNASSFGRTSNSYKHAILPMPVLASFQGLILSALLDHQDDDVYRQLGDRWMVRGPCTYKPVPEVEIHEVRNELIVHPGESLLLKATNDFTDTKGVKRVTGEYWLVSEPGGYLNDVFEKVEETVNAITLTATTGLHLRAEITLTDNQGNQRDAGEEWLVTSKDTDTLYPHVNITVTNTIEKTVLSKGEFCVVLNPKDKKDPKKLRLGCKEVITGPTAFFLHPGECLEGTIRNAYIISDQEAVVLRALKEFQDTEMEGKPQRKCGEKWMITGPVSYVPRKEVEVVDTRTATPLNKNEGIYVRNIRTGKVRAVMGPQAYLLKEYEEPFQKKLPDEVEKLLKTGGGAGSEDIRKVAYFEQSIDPAMLKGRDPSRVVTYRCPGNTACQVYNFRDKTARVIFGPDLVVLGPDENFHVLSLSAGKPKKQNALKSLCLMLGPDFITDIIVVDTSDHARLQIQLAFNNHFEYDPTDLEGSSKLFSVPDFIGYACKQIGGKIRASVAQIAFDEFHRNSKEVIQHAVFGHDEQGRLQTPLKFKANKLVVTGIDVQSIEPVDMKMRESLMKSVQMAIEIATQSIEAAAAAEAMRIEQKARGELERQKLCNEKDEENARIELLELKAETAAVESTGQAVAEARARAESMLIECQSQIECTTLKAEAEGIEHRSTLQNQNLARAAELKYIKAQDELEITHKRKHAMIETQKFSTMVSTLGRGTIQAIANAGPDMQVKLLQGLGLKSTLITDGTTPINLLNTAQGMIGYSRELPEV